MLLAWVNYADIAALVAGSELATLPGANVQQVHLSRKWYTAAAVNASSLTLDMLSPVACALLALLGTNYTATATVRLRASSADPAALATLLLDTGVLAGGVKAGYGAIYKAFANTVARYWRVDVSDASLTQLQTGRLFLGPSWAPSAPQEFGWSVTPMDPSRITTSYGGQDYADIIPQKRVLDFELNWHSESEMYTNAFAMARAQGVAKDVLAIHDINGAFLSEQAVWGRCTAAKPLIHRTTRTFRQQFNIQERL
jgi:hypothetical protein